MPHLSLLLIWYDATLLQDWDALHSGLVSLEKLAIAAGEHTTSGGSSHALKQAAKEAIRDLLSNAKTLQKSAGCFVPGMLESGILNVQRSLVQLALPTDQLYADLQKAQCRAWLHASHAGSAAKCIAEFIAKVSAYKVDLAQAPQLRAAC